MMQLWLDPIPPDRREKAAAAFEAGDVITFLGAADNHHGVQLVFMNAHALQARI